MISVARLARLREGGLSACGPGSVVSPALFRLLAFGSGKAYTKVMG